MRKLLETRLPAWFFLVQGVVALGLGLTFGLGEAGVGNRLVMAAFCVAAGVLLDVAIALRSFDGGWNG